MYHESLQANLFMGARAPSYTYSYCSKKAKCVGALKRRTRRKKETKKERKKQTNLVKTNRPEHSSGLMKDKLPGEQFPSMNLSKSSSKNIIMIL